MAFISNNFSGDANDDAIWVDPRGSADVEVVVEDNTFSNLEDDGILFESDTGQTGGQMILRATNNTFQNRNASGSDIAVKRGDSATTNGLVANIFVDENTFIHLLCKCPNS